MADGKTSDRILLKILSGVQSGAEVALSAGDYALGSGPDDDLQIVDASLKPGHARLRLAPGKIEIAGGAGAIATSTGGKAAAGGDDWLELEPLEIVTAGTVRFALGPVTAQWTTLADAPVDKPEPANGASAARPRASAGQTAAVGRSIAWPIAIIAIAAVVLVYLTQGAKEGRGATTDTAHTDTETIRLALDQFPFGKGLEVRQEVDGTLFVTGFVESPVERRAIVGALEKMAVQPRLRIGVLQALRGEIEGLIKAEKAPLTFTLSAAGDLALEGVMLNDDAMQKFVERVKGSVLGLKQVESRIRTAKTLLSDTEKLAKLSQIENFVVFRLDGEVIEVSGILPTAKIDAWVGFLQAYSRRYAKDIGLRSLVRLQNPDGSPAGDAPTDQAIVIGGKPVGAGDTVLDVEKLKQGQYDLGDIFVAPRNKSGRPLRSGPTVLQANALGQIQPPQVQVGAPPLQTVGVGEARKVDPPAEPTDLTKLTRRADDLLKTWQTAQKTDASGAKAPAGDASMMSALNSLFAARARLGGQPADAPQAPAPAPEKYLPLLGNDIGASRADACRPGSRLTTGNIRTVLFWLDLLSLTSSLSIKDFEVGEQGAVLEAALVPGLAATCLKAAGGRDYVAPSLYLSEAARNPDFANFLTRDLQPFPLDVVGASLSADRYVQIRDGSRLGEGAAPDGLSRIALVGELGVLIRRQSAYSAVIYGQGLNWLIR